MLYPDNCVKCQRQLAAPSLKNEREEGTIVDPSQDIFLIRENHDSFYLQGYAVFSKPYTFHLTTAQEKMSKLWVYCWVRNSNNSRQKRGKPE